MFHKMLQLTLTPQFNAFEHHRTDIIRLHVYFFGCEFQQTYIIYYLIVNE